MKLKIHLYDFANKIKYSKITNVSCFKMAKGYIKVKYVTGESLIHCEPTAE